MPRSIEYITGAGFRRMMTGAYRTFLCEHEAINRLNVFPVPDGDTGTNMLLTLQAVYRSLAETSDGGIGAISRRAADSAIMGARGNSGVILSQIFRGIARGLGGKEQASSGELAKAFQYGVLYAYRAVARPVEGTILTVAKGIAKGAYRAVRENLPFEDILRTAIEAGNAELERTPELLPALKSAGVVDAGGKGLIVFLRGCLEGLEGTFTGPEAGLDLALSPATAGDGDWNEAHPYCTEFIVKRCTIPPETVKEQLMALGDSLVLAAGEGILKVHIHTAHPGNVLELAIVWGTLHDIKIDNMADQHRERFAGEAKRSGLMVISVASGNGLEAIMHNLGAEVVLSGGQTMNPPVEEFVNAVHNSNAKQYIILPNNKNIVLAAKQAQKLLGGKAEIVPAVSIPQGVAALMAFDSAASLEDNIGRMTARMQKVKSAEITVAVRNSEFNGCSIHEGAYIAVIASKVVATGDRLDSVVEAAIQQLTGPDSEIVTLYYGEMVSAEQARRIADLTAQKASPVPVELYYGGQLHYHFIIGVE